MDKTNIRFGMGANASENQAADETFLSQELAINLLQVIIHYSSQKSIFKKVDNRTPTNTDKSKFLKSYS